MPKVLHIFTQLDRGGAEIRTMEVMRHLQGRVGMHFCSLSGLKGALDGQVRDLGCEVHHLKIGPRFPLQFRRLVHKERFDAVHSHVFGFTWLILWLAHWEGIPKRIAHFRSTSFGSGLRRRLQQSLMNRLIRRHATHILAVSEGAMEKAWDKNWRKDPRASVVYSGVDAAPYAGAVDRDRARRSLGLPSDCHLFIHVGRFDPAKNHERLLQIFREIANSDKGARLLLAGAGNAPRERRIRELAGTLGLDDRIVFGGLRTDVPQLLMASDAMIFPSMWEGLPGAVVKACAAGIPVVASDLPGIREIAHYFSDSLTILSLEASDKVWSDHALKTAWIGRRTPGKGLPLADTPFTVEQSAKALHQIWA